MRRNSSSSSSKRVYVLVHLHQLPGSADTFEV
jgi:hypothetical protein